MDVARIRRVFSLTVFTLFLELSVRSAAYEIPDVTIQAFRPKGFRASIPASPNVALFVFQGNVNRPIADKGVGTLTGEVTQATNDRWVFEDPDVKLKVGDVINYYVYVSADSAGYIKDNLKFTVTELEDRSAKKPVSTECLPTLTKLRGGSACAGQTIFEDNFDSLREDLWQIEQFIPVNHPEYPFVSYQRVSSDPTVVVVDGNLRIAPELQQDLPGFNRDSIYSGTLNLFSGCTGSANECSAQAWGASILPPVVSGRVTSKGFAFTYGTVHVRAKLPQGDWLYPEILLEPFLKKYGNMNYASGVLRIAAARGNRQLNAGAKDFGNKVLYGGPIMDLKCREYLIYEKKLTDGKMWGDEFHVYSVTWTPDRITLQVDYEEWAHIEPAEGGLRGHFPSTCDDMPQSLLAAGSSVAPFDDHFYLTLGVAAGGITEFRDGVTTQDGRPKPWRNQARKASLNFWENVDSWLPTWAQGAMLVDYVKVVAL